MKSIFVFSVGAGVRAGSYSEVYLWFFSRGRGGRRWWSRGVSSGSFTLQVRHESHPLVVAVPAFGLVVTEDIFKSDDEET